MLLHTLHGKYFHGVLSCCYFTHTWKIIPDSLKNFFKEWCEITLIPQTLKILFQGVGEIDLPIKNASNNDHKLLEIIRVATK
jgi:hypothetical protein